MAQPCRRRQRDTLVSSVYHSTPLFRGLLTALDDGLNRYTPCPCPSCCTSKKRPAPHYPDTPPPKRVRAPSPTTHFSPHPVDTIHYCKYCAFPDRSTRLSCRECARRSSPPVMAQNFIITRSSATHRKVDRATPAKSSKPLRHTRPQPPPQVSHDQFSSEQFFFEPEHHASDRTTDLSASCDFSFSSQLQSPHLSDPHAQIPLHTPMPPLNVPHPQYQSPQSTVPDPTDFADYESICTPEPRSMASKSLAYHSAAKPAYRHIEDISVASFIHDVSKEMREDRQSMQALENARLSLMSSALSDVTSESAVEFSHPAHVRTNVIGQCDSTQQVTEHNVADIFLSEIIMSHEDDADKDPCNGIPDLPLMFLDGILPLSEQDTC